MADDRTDSEPTRDYTQVEQLNNEKFRSLVLGLQEALNTAKLFTAEAEEKKEEIRALLQQAKVQKVAVDDVKVILAKGRQTRKLDVDKLIALGVPASKIEASYVLPPPGKPSVRLYSVVEEEE